MELFHESVLQLRPVLELEDSRTIGVKIRQAGPEEVRLDIAAPLEVGRIVILRIEDEQERTWYRAAAEIHWAQPIPIGTSIGLYLNQPLSEELLAWPEWDRRESLRYPIEMPARIWWQGSRTSSPALVANYSLHGVGVICPEQVTLGTPAIIAAGNTVDTQICVAATACWQVQARDGVMIGFEMKSHDGKRFGARARECTPLTQVEPLASSLMLSH